MRNSIFLFKLLEIEAWSDLTKLSIFLEQFADLCFVGGLIDFVSTIKFLDVVHES
jgi:hypothetical protein